MQLTNNERDKYNQNKHGGIIFMFGMGQHNWPDHMLYIYTQNYTYVNKHHPQKVYDLNPKYMPSFQ